jgi:hypothetical protein
MEHDVNQHIVEFVYLQLTQHREVVGVVPWCEIVDFHFDILTLPSIHLHVFPMLKAPFFDDADCSDVDPSPCLGRLLAATAAFSWSLVRWVPCLPGHLSTLPCVFRCFVLYFHDTEV